MCTASGPKLVLTQFIFTLISILLIRINSHYVTFSSLPFKNECSVNDSVIIHHFYCNYRHDYFHHFSDSNVPSPTLTLLCSTISPTPMFLLRLQRCYVPPFLRHDFILKKLKNLLVIFYMYVHHHYSNNKSLFNIIYTVLSKSPFIYTFISLVITSTLFPLRYPLLLLFSK